ncbi:MAG: ribose ABC transporter permease [Pasteurella sp.]|nr:ribose ABC transporter permease [Pasteurella sp.]
MKNKSSILQTVNRRSEFIPFIGLVLLVILMSLMIDNFFAWQTFVNISRQVSVNAIIAAGMTFVILTGGIDLSVGAVMAFAGTILAGIIIYFTPGVKEGDVSLTTALILGWLGALFIGISCGAFSGFFVSRFGLPAIIVTLAVMTAVRGVGLTYTGGYPMPMSRIFSALGRSEFLSIPIPAWIMFAVYILSYLLLNKFRLGRYIYAVGGNEDAAILSGIRTKWIHFFVYSYCGFTAAIAGIISTSRVSSGQPASGEGFELDAIAAVVLGGTSIMGGRGSVIGTLIGAFILGVLNTGLNIWGVPPYPQRIIKGSIILGAVLISVFQKQSKK